MMTAGYRGGQRPLASRCKAHRTPAWYISRHPSRAYPPKRFSPRYYQAVLQAINLQPSTIFVQSSYSKQARMMLAQRAATGRAVAPAVAPRVFVPQTCRPVVLRRYKEGEQADTSGQGSKAPRNPITGQRLTPISSEKEGYQATEQIPQSEATSARINKQLGGQSEGRAFGGK